jgi:hypothetical protein
VKKLAKKIERDLESSAESVVFNSQLARVWPAKLPVEKREKLIRTFAKKRGLEVKVYPIGLCAIFAKRKSKNRPSGKRRITE